MWIAIDGPAASGKSTAAKLLAKKLGFLYIDTGAMYRAVTLEALRRGLSFKKEDDIIKIAEFINIGLKQDWTDSRGFKVFIGDEDVTEKLFILEVDSKVSIVARISKVREILVKAQQKLAKGKNVVMAGRDIGSNVLKDAQLKIFLTADAKIRALRRQKELKEKGILKEYKEIFNNIIKRDEIDSGRVDNPLIKTSDAFQVDCSNLTIEEMVDVIIEKVRSVKN